MARVERWLCDQCNKLGESEPPNSSNLPKGWDELTMEFQDDSRITKTICGQGCAKAFANEIIVKQFEQATELAEVGIHD